MDMEAWMKLTRDERVSLDERQKIASMNRKKKLINTIHKQYKINHKKFK